jgi:hypothetical protein
VFAANALLGDLELQVRAPHEGALLDGDDPLDFVASRHFLAQAEPLVDAGRAPLAGPSRRNLVSVLAVYSAYQQRHYSKE